ncbi:hypothetical protein T492DRAFT_847836 [Pavlovales sp. CCMP2436]|nr:hypothetical protein T492DRAFT_847836 [Pavlovales sp. CCMP2436]
MSAQGGTRTMHAQTIRAVVCGEIQSVLMQMRRSSRWAHMRQNPVHSSWTELVYKLKLARRTVASHASHASSIHFIPCPPRTARPLARCPRARLLRLLGSPPTPPPRCAGCALGADEWRRDGGGARSRAQAAATGRARHDLAHSPFPSPKPLVTLDDELTTHTHTFIPLLLSNRAPLPSYPTHIHTPAFPYSSQTLSPSSSPPPTLFFRAALDDELTARAAMSSIVSSATHCRFEASDPASDEVVLMHLLQMLPVVSLLSSELSLYSPMFPEPSASPSPSSNRLLPLFIAIFEYL